MKTGLWFVWCKKTQALSVEALRERLKVPFDGKVAIVDDVLEIEFHDKLLGNDAAISFGLATDPHIALEAQEVAERSSEMVDEPSDEAIRAIAVADARYEISWDLALSAEVFNMLAIIAEQLSKLTEGIIHDPRARRLV